VYIQPELQKPFEIYSFKLKVRRIKKDQISGEGGGIVMGMLCLTPPLFRCGLRINLVLRDNLNSIS
jgi:hypothetical protein